jgi:inorganic phosphate transporter, PiT family
MGLGIAIAFTLAFSVTNGFHDAANAIATLVATRGARPGEAVVVSSVFNVIGVLVLDTAVADTIAGIVAVDKRSAVAVIGSGVLGAVLWNLFTWWRGLPSGSGHALVRGLVGSALADAGVSAVDWAASRTAGRSASSGCWSRWPSRRCWGFCSGTRSRASPSAPCIAPRVAFAFPSAPPSG